MCLFCVLQLIGANGMLVRDLVGHIVTEFHMERHQVCTSAPRQLINPDAEANLLKNQTIVVENPDHSYVDTLPGESTSHSTFL